MWEILAAICSFIFLGLLIYDFGWMFVRNARGYVFDNKTFGFDQRLLLIQRAHDRYGFFVTLVIILSFFYSLTLVLAAIAPTACSPHCGDKLWGINALYVIIVVGYFAIATILQHARAVVELQRLKDKR